MAVLFWLGTSSFTLCFDFQAIYDVFNKWHGIDLWGGEIGKASLLRIQSPPFFPFMCHRSIQQSLEMKSRDSHGALFLEGTNVITDKKVL